VKIRGFFCAKTECFYWRGAGKKLKKLGVSYSFSPLWNAETFVNLKTSPDEHFARKPLAWIQRDETVSALKTWLPCFGYSLAGGLQYGYATR